MYIGDKPQQAKLTFKKTVELKLLQRNFQNNSKLFKDKNFLPVNNLTAKQQFPEFTTAIT